MPTFPLSDPAGVHSSRWARILLAALALLGALTLGCLPLIDEDEGEYSEVAVEMAHSGDFLAPTLNGQPFYEKPILLFWLQAPLLRAFGSHEWALRLPPFIASCAWILAIIGWWRARRGEGEALAAAWIAATCLGVALVARAAAMDALINLLLALTLFDLWLWIEGGRRFHLRRAALWAALGALAKGPVALVIPAAVLIAYFALTPGARVRARALVDPWAWLILLAVALPWYVWYGVHSDGAFWRYFLLRENVGRLGGSLQGHGGGYGYYVVVLPLLLLPHTGVLAGLVAASRRLWAAPCERFLLLWFALVFLIFTLAGTKLPHYLLYGCTPLFLLGARCLPRGRARAQWAGFVLPALALALPSLARHFALHDGNPYIREMLGRSDLVFDQVYWIRTGLWCACALACPWLVAWAGRHVDDGRAPASARPERGAVHDDTRFGRAMLAQLIVPGLVSVLGVSLVLLPTVTAFQQDPVRAAARFAATLATPVVSDNRMPSFSVYLGHPTLVRALQAGDIAFGRLDHPDRLGRRYDALFAQGGIRVVRVIEP